MFLFDLLSHVGTVVASLFVFRRSIVKLVGVVLRDLRSAWWPPGNGLLPVMLAVIAMIPTGIIGLSFKDQFEQAFEHPSWIGYGLLMTGTILAMTALIPKGKRGWRQFSWWRAGLVGVAQGIAIFPGISRSGSTICTASFVGLRRQWAGEFSFLIGVPAICLAALIKLKDVFSMPSQEVDSLPWGPVLVGTAVSTVVGVAALMWLLRAVRRGKLHYFAMYCWIMGLLLVTKML